MSQVELIGVAKSYGGVVALHEVDLEVRQGELVTLLGPSGCGKTTTLRLIAGFIEPTKGTISLGGEDVTRLAPHRREIGMVFQDYALFPHMTVADNIAFGLVERGEAKAVIDRRVTELLELIRLPQVAKRFPSELSGGQAQRVAFARAISHPPRVLLMDEPLGALDLKLREAMQVELRRLQQALGITTVLVTHDQGEAMTMSDRIAVMNHGRIEQIGSGEDIYRSPASRFVAGFVGQVNLLEGKVVASGDGMTTVSVANAGPVRVIDARNLAPGSAAAVAVRPEKMRLVGNGDGSGEFNTLHGRVMSRTFGGSTAKLLVDVGAEKPIAIEDKPEVLAALIGDTVAVGWSAEDARLLDA